MTSCSEGREMRLLSRFAIVLLLAATMVAPGCGGKENKGKPADKAKGKPSMSFIGESAVLPVKAVEVKQAPPSFELNLPGVVQANVESTLSFRVPGTITEFPVKIGQEMRKGDLIARLDATHYENAVAQAEASRQEALANQQDASAQYGRVRKLWADQDMSTSQMDEARTSARTASQQVKIAGKQLAEARRELANSTLSAPYDGTVANKQVLNYQTVQAGQPVVLFVDTSSMQLRAQLPSSMLWEKDHFSDYKCVFPSLGGLTVDAQLKGIGPSALPPHRTYPVTVVITPPEGTPILPGTEGILRITVTNPGQADYTLVPATAVTSDHKGQSRIWTVDTKTGEAQPRPVEIEALHDGQIALRSGVQAGEWVITAGQNRLTPGRKVKIVKQTGTN